VQKGNHWDEIERYEAPYPRHMQYFELRPTELLLLKKLWEFSILTVEALSGRSQRLLY
jgi:hypothetical protein